MSSHRDDHSSVRLLALAAALAIGCTSAIGQTSPATQPEAPARPAMDLPEAKIVIADYVEALGGEKALRAVKSRKLSGSMSMGDMGMSMDMTIISAAPNKMTVTASSDDFGSFRQGFDGKVAWSIDPMSGPQILGGERHSQMADQADFTPELSYEKRYKSMKCVDRKEMDGKECFVIQLITKEDIEQTEYFDVQTHLLTATVMTTDSQFGQLTFTSHAREYTTIEGIKIPTTIEIESDEMVRTMKFDVVEINKVDPDAFDLPAEIKAILPEDDENATQPEKGDGG